MHTQDTRRRNVCDTGLSNFHEARALQMRIFQSPRAAQPFTSWSREHGGERACRVHAGFPQRRVSLRPRREKKAPRRGCYTLFLTRSPVLCIYICTLKFAESGTARASFFCSPWSIAVIVDFFARPEMRMGVAPGEKYTGACKRSASRIYVEITMRLQSLRPLWRRSLGFGISDGAGRLFCCALICRSYILTAI